MIWNRKWEKPKTKIDPISVAGLIEWLEKQDPKQRYDFVNCNGGCLIGLYYTAILGANFLSHPDRPTFADVFGPRGSNVRRQGYGDVAATRPYTFGAALERAREFAAAH